MKKYRYRSISGLFRVLLISQQLGLGAAAASRAELCSYTLTWGSPINFGSNSQKTNITHKKSFYKLAIANLN